MVESDEPDKTKSLLKPMQLMGPLIVRYFERGKLTCGLTEFWMQYVSFANYLVLLVWSKTFSNSLLRSLFARDMNI